MNGWIFFERLGLHGWTAEAKRNDKHYSMTHVALPHQSQTAPICHVWPQKVCHPFNPRDFPRVYRNWQQKLLTQNVNNAVFAKPFSMFELKIMQSHGINGYLRKELQILCFGPAVKNVIYCFPATVLYVYIDFCQQVKTTIINICMFCT